MHFVCLENAKKKAELDLIMKLAEEKKAKKRLELRDLRDEFRELQIKNAELPEHVQLNKEAFELDRQIREEIEKQIADRIELVYKEMAWEQEKYRIGLQKLQARDSLKPSSAEAGHLGHRIHTDPPKGIPRRPTPYSIH
eukprot:g46414.t1